MAAQIVNHQDDGDSATISVIDRETGLYACHSSFLRGGCLYAGTVMLRNLKAGGGREFEITSWASASDAHVAYLLSLAEKHVGGAR